MDWIAERKKMARDCRESVVRAGVGPSEGAVDAAFVLPTACVDFNISCSGPRLSRISLCINQGCVMRGMTFRRSTLRMISRTMYRSGSDS